MTRPTYVLALAALLAAGPVTRAAEPFQIPFDKVEAKDATYAVAGETLRVSTGHTTEYPGVTLRPAGKAWDLSPYGELVVTVKNTSGGAIEVAARVDSTVTRDEKDEPHSMTQRVKVAAGETGRPALPLERAPAGAKAPRLFGMRGVPAYAKLAEKKYGDPARVTGVALFLTRPTADFTFEVARAAAEGEYVPPKIPDPVFPLIDAFGQHKHADWPGKTHSAEELKAAHEAELKDLAARPGPESWNAYGGWETGPKREATGWFRTEKVDGKWWLVDPAGRLFFSHGITCVGNGSDTPVDEREAWFEWLPAETDPTFGPMFGKRKAAIMGYYVDKPGKAFSFANANLARVYGDGWKDQAARTAHARLRSWGINTMGNWSDKNYTALDKTPYVVPVNFDRKTIEGSKGYWGKFPDPFDPAFRPNLEAALKKLGKPVGDPWCIGFFVDNELSWGDTTQLAVSTLESPAAQPAKAAFVAALKQKYKDVAALNAAWGTGHASWDALAESRAAPDRKKADADLKAFNRTFCETYFRHCRDAVKALAPHQLYLGPRFAWSNDMAQEVAADYCDVVSYNLYRRGVANFKPAFAKDVPIMNTEWHLGALDRGMFHPGLIPVKDQAERGRLYAQIVREHLAHPQFVGCHWFQYRDQPVTGRTIDGENYQIGFVDVCDRPYGETVAAAREVGYALYQARAGK